MPYLNRCKYPGCDALFRLEIRKKHCKQHNMAAKKQNLKLMGYELIVEW